MNTSAADLAKFEAELTDQVADYYSDPLGFVLFAYPWGQPGPLANYDGPCPCQRRVLEVLGEEVRKRKFDGKTPVKPIRIAVSSGHGIGKSALSGMIVDWIQSTRPGAQGTVTANTFTQLQTKTWSAIQHWTKLCLTEHWFTVTGDRLYESDHRESWFVSAQSCREENSEAFAGQHAASSTSFYINDEGSAIPDKIFEVQEGGLTDGEPMQIIFGNPTRATGKFYRACFGSERNRWIQIIIDSRECPLTNKAQIDEWIEDFGEDSDFVRVRVRGLPPSASDLQFIDTERVRGAQRREVRVFDDELLIAGLDVARGGGDRNVMRFRRGLDAKSVPPMVIPGEETRDTMKLATWVAEQMTREFAGRKIAMLFVDAGFGGPVVDRCHQLGFDNVVEVNFGANAPDKHFANMRSYMWGQAKTWLLKGSIDTSERLSTDLTGPEFHHNRRDQIVLEPKESMKKRGLDSPDDGDALALTFAMPVSPRVEIEPSYAPSSVDWQSV